MIFPLWTRASKRTLIAMALFSNAFLFACAKYEVKVNNQVLYSPPELFVGYKIEDKALAECVRSTIMENNIVSAEALEVLLCPPGDIRSLSGLGVFSQLKQLGLSQNRIQSLDELLFLKQLQQLDLSQNQIQELTNMRELKALEYADLRGNPLSACPDLAEQLSKTELLLPETCN